MLMISNTGCIIDIYIGRQTLHYTGSHAKLDTDVFANIYSLVIGWFINLTVTVIQQYSSDWRSCNFILKQTEETIR